MADKTYRILVIGNGFDLAHGLRTKYMDYLDSLKWLKDNYNKNDSFDESKEHLYNLYNSLKEVNELKNFYDLGVKNYWTDYFLSIFDITHHEKNWIDFEDEILKFIMNIDELFNIGSFKNNEIGRIKKSKHYNNWLKGSDVIGEDKFIISEFLYNQLLDFTRAFEIYCFYYINKIDADSLINNFYGESISVKRLEPEVRIAHLKHKLESTKIKKPIRELIEKELSDEEYRLNYKKGRIFGIFDRVLTFNYTNTYERIYGNAYNYCYIHGKAQKDAKKTDIIFGINEYLTHEKRNTDFTFLKFKKYFQRIYKKTGSEYRDWLNEDRECEVYFFGHSFGESDEDIIREFLLHDKCKNHILYRDENSKLEIIKKTIKIISQEELIKRVHGKDWKIIFEHQNAFKELFLEEASHKMNLAYKFHKVVT